MPHFANRKTSPHNPTRVRPLTTRMNVGLYERLRRYRPIVQTATLAVFIVIGIGTTSRISNISMLILRSTEDNNPSHLNNVFAQNNTFVNHNARLIPAKTRTPLTVEQPAFFIAGSPNSGTGETRTAPSSEPQTPIKSAQEPPHVAPEPTANTNPTQETSPASDQELTPVSEPTAEPSTTAEQPPNIFPAPELPELAEPPTKSP